MTDKPAVRVVIYSPRPQHSCIACGDECDCGSLFAVQCQLCRACQREADRQFNAEKGAET